MTQTFIFITLLLSTSGLLANGEIFLDKDGCQQYTSSSASNATSTTVYDCRHSEHCILSSVELWQGIVLMLCYGAFALLMTLVYKIIRNYIYYDSHLLDTFFDAGGDVNFALLACYVVIKSTWTTSYTWSSHDTVKYGVVGGFWYAAAMTVHLLLFAIVACEVRIKAPGAKTFLQVIYRRYGAATHLVLLVFAVVVNVVVSGVALTEGAKIIGILTQELSPEVASIVISAVVGMFTIVGGLGGTIYVAYFACGLLMCVLVVYYVDVFYDPLDHYDDNKWYGRWEPLWEAVRCARGPDSNEERSIVTFLSENGMLQGIIILITGFSSTFVNQSYWAASTASRPGHAVWAFLIGAVLFLAVPLSASFFFGLNFWKFSLDHGQIVMSDSDAMAGFLPVYVSQRLLDKTGDFLMYVMTLSVCIIAASSEILALSAIVIYDVYQTYINPFKASASSNSSEIGIRMRKVAQNEEYLEYDRRCSMVKHVAILCSTVILFVICLALLKVDIDVPWLLQMLGVVAGSCVIPVALAITWHRITQAGVISGCLGGLIAGVITWIAYAATYDGGLEKFRVNTGQQHVMLSASVVSLGFGGFLCIVISLSCGGCSKLLLEEEEWEKTRMIDNPILPWSVRYAPDIQEFQRTKGTPHFYTVRRTYKCAEIAAYILGVLLSVSAVLVWPACMLLVDVFDKDTFYIWFMVVFVWLLAAACFLLLVPIVLEIAQVCRQAYYNRAWKRSERHERLDEDASSEARPAHEAAGTLSGSYGTASSLNKATVFTSSSEPKEDSSRWRTYIELD